MSEKVVSIDRAFTKGQKRRAAKLIKAGRPRLFAIERQPNGQPSRRKQYHPPEPSWLAPSIKRGLNMYTVDALASRGCITQDQAKAAYSWIADRSRTGLPYTRPPALDMNKVIGAVEVLDKISATRRYHDLNTILKQRCGVFGHSLAYVTIIEGRQDEAVAQYWFRLGQSPKIDPTSRQIMAWQHLKLAFEEIENFYATVTKKKLDRTTEAA
jgi:hypothetical protein